MFGWSGDRALHGVGRGMGQEGGDTQLPTSCGCYGPVSEMGQEYDALQLCLAPVFP